MKAWKFLILFSFSLFPSCAMKPVAEIVNDDADQIGIFSTLGSNFYVTHMGKTIFQKKEQQFDVGTWGVDAEASILIMEEFTDRGKKMVPLSLPEEKWRPILEEGNHGIKNFLWKTNDKFNRFVLDEAEKQGAKYLFMLSPLESSDSYPMHRGPMGLMCFHRPLRKTKSTPYYLFEISFWNVERKKQIFRETINPAMSEKKSSIECASLRNISEATLLKSVKKSMMGALEDCLDQTWEKIGINEED